MKPTIDPTASIGQRAVSALQAIKIWTETLVLVAAVAGTLSAGIIAWVTSGVRAEIREVRYDLETRAFRDSVRFLRVMDVVELTALAIVEAEGSAGRAWAIQQLRE